MGFIPNFTSLLAFGSAFAFGWFLHRQQTLLETLKRDWLPNLVAACLLSAFALAIVGVTSRFSIIELPGRERLAYAVVYMLACWYWIFGLIGAALRFLARPNARWRYLADASFFMYLVHLPIVNVLQVWMIRWPVHWLLKYLLIVSLTMIVLLAMYEYLVRSTFVGQFLVAANTREARRTSRRRVFHRDESPAARSKLRGQTPRKRGFFSPARGGSGRAARSPASAPSASPSAAAICISSCADRGSSLLDLGQQRVDAGSGEFSVFLGNA